MYDGTAAKGQGGSLNGIVGHAMNMSDVGLLDTFRGVAIQGYDADRRVFYWNDASETLYGYRKDEAIGSLLEDLIIPDAAREAVIKEIHSWVSGEEPPVGGTLDLKRKDGTLVRVRSNHLALHDDQGRFRLFCIDLPIEQQVALESSLNELWPIDGAADFWVSALQHAQTHRPGVAADVRTPLNAVMAFCDTLCQHVGERSEALPDLKTMGIDADVAHAVKQNLALLGAAPLNLDPRSKVVAAQDVLVEVAGMVLAARSDREDLVRVQAVPADLNVFADPFLLKHALAGLVHFGIHNGSGRGPVILSVRARHSVRDTVIFSVEDGGPPIPDELRIRLLSGQAAFSDRYHAKDFAGLFYLSIAQRIALSTGAFLSFEETQNGTNRCGLGVGLT